MMSLFNQNNLINIVAFKAIWLTAVIGASNNLVYPTFILVFLFTFWQLQPKRRHPNDVLFIFLALPIGYVLDSIWQATGLIHYNAGNGYCAPTWILFLWITFAQLFNHSLSWLKKSPVAAALFGGLGGPISYYAGHKLGALEYPTDFATASFLLSISWSAVVLFFTQYEKYPILNYLTKTQNNGG
jgi:hypothetical protein